MRRSRWAAAGALMTSAALVLTGCGGGGDNSGGTTNKDAGITVFNTEPENPLVPSNTTEFGGSQVISALFTGLVEYNSDTTAVENAMADSITDVEAKVYTIKIKKGWKFHDGTEVKAKNFVDAWNWGAYGPNATQGGSFFADIQGYDEVHPKDPDGQSGPQKAPTPATDKMSGLKVIDDHTFEVTLRDSSPVFKTKLGYETFSPMPDSFFADKAGFEAKPIGNGPFKFVSRQVGTEIKLTRFDEYTGADKPKFKDLTFKVYQSREAAYADIVGNKLDFMEELPPNAMAGKQYKTDLADRAIERQTLNNQTLAFPLYQEKYKNPDLRKAISMAINREEITQRIYEGSRQPADGLVHPLMKGYLKGQCGEFCTYNPAKAKEYLAKSGFTGQLKVLSNTDGGHSEWATAVANSIKNTLNIDCVFEPATSFGDFRQKVNSRGMSDMYRAGWIADYPSIENWLNPLYKTGTSSNDGEYSSPAVDAKLAEADHAKSEDEGIRLYLEAERMILQDMPVVPLWTQNTISGKSNRLKVAKLDPFRKLDLATVEVA
ncbi:peptide ABC transporter substrate-binding protein [Amycolatopsis anabasis]|uniref:peptide ABC transporter substrate-binding protein n=1 Tax=Amycolatopsis anabasis TaxID=1840409 RepID=UPI00131EC3E8|nr:ABC transporter substrate-binding protein [Amycolatopsis anabasis]